MVTVQLTLRTAGRANPKAPVTATAILLREFPFLTLEVAGTTGTVRSLSATGRSVALTLLAGVGLALLTWLGRRGRGA